MAASALRYGATSLFRDCVGIHVLWTRLPELWTLALNNKLNTKSRLNKRWIAYAFLGCLIVLIVVFFFGPHLGLGASRKQMNDAKKIMDSLTDKDIQALIQRTQTILREDASVEFTNRDVPPDLKQLGIAGIEENTDEVDYVWFGGMDNTALDVVRMSNGNFQVIAVYTPYSNRMIWPKR
jgi:hypothetical protein